MRQGEGRTVDADKVRGLRVGGGVLSANDDRGTIEWDDSSVWIGH